MRRVVYLPETPHSINNSIEPQAPNIKFEPEDIENWADKYNYGGGSGRERGIAVFALIDQVRNRQLLDKERS